MIEFENQPRPEPNPESHQDPVIKEILEETDFEWYRDIAEVLRNGFPGSDLRLEHEQVETKQQITVRGSELDLKRFEAVTGAYKTAKKDRMTEEGIAAVVVETLQLQRARYS